MFKNHVLKRVVFCSCVLLFAVLIAAAPYSSLGLGSGRKTRRDVPVHTLHPPHLHDRERGPHLYLNMDIPTAKAQATHGPASLIPWSKLVFQSYRDGNWELYVADDDGSGQTRLTYDGAADVNPRLNRGCTRIAFSSKRPGNYEIFTMNVDGSVLAQLTFTDAAEYNPSWSPNGAKIAFNSYRDGQGEIYVMNGDGSGQTRLTTDLAWDGEAAWSPDGSKIAFSSSRAGQDHIWVMNADGSEPTQLSTQPYSENAAWSPDGSQIAFDADGNGDGWNELWVMNADGTSERAVYYPSAFQTDTVVRSWSPDGRYVAFTQFSWIYYRGNWYWTTAYVDAWDSVSGGVARINTGTDADAYPDWQTTDGLAPISRVKKLPTHARSGITINWEGSDNGGSALKSFDVQVRAADARAWNDWQMDTTVTASPFTGTPGDSYYFRSRARDNAYNSESWPAGDGDAFATLYSWVISGRVCDNTGTPIMGIAPTVAPSAFETHASCADGTYVAYAADSAAAYTVAWERSGYGNLPLTSFASAPDAYVDAVLPPANNIVQNWGFESGNLSADDWTTSGAAPPVLTAVKHTGERAVLFGVAPVTQTSDSAIAQTVTVPMTMCNPTLSFLYKRDHGLVLWNKLGSDSEVLHSEVGQNGAIVGVSHAYELARHGLGYIRKASGQNYVAFPATVLDDLHHRGTIELWINPKVTQPVPYVYGVFGLVGAPFGHGDVPGDYNIWLLWGDTVTEQGLFGGVKFDADAVQTPAEPTQFVAQPLKPFHAAICWDIAGIDGTADKVRVYRDGRSVGSTADSWNPSGTDRYDIILGYGADGEGYDKFIVDNIVAWSYARTDFSHRFTEAPLASAAEVSGSQLSVQISDRLTTNTVFSTASSTEGWVQHWLDLSPWAGQTVTLTFNVQLEPGEPHTLTYLDEVNIGSAYADLWISANNPAALPGKQAIYSIAFGNQGGAPADDVRITTTLPAELFFVDASPPPAFNAQLWTWEWDTGDLPAKSERFTIVLTTTVAPSATLFSALTTNLAIGAASPELETANNTSGAAVFVGKRIYLPLAVRKFSGW